MEIVSPQADVIGNLLDQLTTACEQYTHALCTAYEAGTYTLALKDVDRAVNTLSEAVEQAPDVDELVDQINNLINNGTLLTTDSRFPVIRYLLTLLNSKEEEFINLVSEIQDQQDNLLDVVQLYYTSGSSEQYQELVQNNTRQFLYSIEEGLLLPLT